jgi:hypothetical protein
MNIKFDTKKLDRLQRNAKNLYRKTIATIPLKDWLTDSFLSKHTEYKSFSEIENLSKEDFTKPEVLAKIKFASFDEMLRQAQKENPHVMAAAKKRGQANIKRNLFRGI